MHVRASEAVNRTGRGEGEALCCAAGLLLPNPDSQRKPIGREPRRTNHKPSPFSPSNRQRITWRPKKENTPAPNCTSTHLTSFDIAPGHGTAVHRLRVWKHRTGVAEQVDDSAVSPSGYRQWRCVRRAHMSCHYPAVEFEPRLSVRSVCLFGWLHRTERRQHIHTACTSPGLRSAALLFQPSLSFLAGRAAGGPSRV